MDENPYKAPRKSLRDHAGHDADFFFLAAIAVFFGVPGIVTEVVSLWALAWGIAGADIGPDLTPFDLAVMTIIPTVPCLVIGTVAWATARGFRE